MSSFLECTSPPSPLGRKRQLDHPLASLNPLPPPPPDLFFSSTFFPLPSSLSSQFPSLVPRCEQKFGTQKDGQGTRLWKVRSTNLKSWVVYYSQWKADQVVWVSHLPLSYLVNFAICIMYLAILLAAATMALSSHCLASRSSWWAAYCEVPQCMCMDCIFGYKHTNHKQSMYSQPSAHDYALMGCLLWAMRWTSVCVWIVILVINIQTINNPCTAICTWLCSDGLHTVSHEVDQYVCMDCIFGYKHTNHQQSITTHVQPSAHDYALHLKHCTTQIVHIEERDLKLTRTSKCACFKDGTHDLN